jgi:hypothetical protein
MKTVLFFLASVLVFASCENYYIDQNLGGSDFNPTDVRTIDYTLTDADYKSIVSNKDNIALALAECTAEDSSAYTAFLQIAIDMAFNKIAVADVYVPAFLGAKFPQLSKGSLFNITYNTCEGAPAYLTTFANTTKYALSAADYETIWGGKKGINYLTPATMMQLSSVLPAEGEEGALLAVVYDYKDSEPSFGGGSDDDDEDTPKGFFDGTPETRGYWTPAEVMAAYAAGTLKEGDSLKVGGILGEWYSKSLNTTYGNLDYYLYDQDGTSRFEMWRSFSLNSALWASYDFVDVTNATATDVNGFSITVGDTIIGIGAFKYYADYDVYEFNSGCYIVEHRPVVASAAPKKVAAAANGKKTVLYQYTNGKWSAYKNADATVVVLPEDVYSAVGYTYLLDKNKNILTSFLAQEYPYAQAGNAYTVVYVAAVDKDTNVPTYNAIEFIYDGTAFVENLGMSQTTTTFSLSDVWGSTIYYKQYIMGEGQGKLTIQDVNLQDPLTYVWYYSAAYGMCASAYKDGASYDCESWLVTPMIDLTRAKTPQFSFDQAFNKAPNFTEEAAVFVSTDYVDDVTKATWTQLEWNTNEDGTLNVPGGTSWVFQPSGYFDMSAYVGEKIHIAFRYTTSNGVSGTWEIRNLLLSEPEN